MKFIEVDCFFVKNIDKDEKDYMSSIHGENIDEWPEPENYYEIRTISIRLDQIQSFNSSHVEGRTRVRMIGDVDGYWVDMKYGDFKAIVNNALK